MTRNHLVLSFSLVFAALLARAEPSRAEGFATRGSWVALGEISYDRDDFESTRGSLPIARGNRQKVSVAPEVGYFVLDGLLLAGGVGVSFDRLSDRASTDRTTAVAVTLKPAYYLPIADGLFLHALVPVSAIVGGGYRNESKSTGTSTEGGITGWSAGVGGGLAYALGVERGGFARLTLDYSLQSLTFAPDTGTSTKVEQGAFSVGVGFGAHF